MQEITYSKHVAGSNTDLMLLDFGYINRYCQDSLQVHFINYYHGSEELGNAGYRERLGGVVR